MEIENNFEALLDEVSFNEESAASDSDYHNDLSTDSVSKKLRFYIMLKPTL